MKPIISAEASVLKELDEIRPKQSPALLSRDQRHRLVERAFLGLYRWYIARSQETRNWNPDKTFDWREYRKDHSPEIQRIVEGFFAVEQYVPDYVTALLKVIRKSYGRSHLHLRWGSEEEKHADMWRNAVLFGGHRSLEWIEAYTDELRGQEWSLPWDDPLHMLFYTVFQERATQVNYVNLGLIAKGKAPNGAFADDEDPVLAHACRTIAVDEAAHYNFFLEGARLMLYYFPEESVEAMCDVLRHFAMPAGNIIPNYAEFSETVYKAGVYGPRSHSTDVVKVALEQLGSPGVRAVENGIRKSREVPDENGQVRLTSIFETIDYQFVETRVKNLFSKVGSYEEEIGFDQYAPTLFVPNPDLESFRERVAQTQPENA
jgi:acyl-[acyl-carrier-protein] desaturase